MNTIQNDYSRQVNILNPEEFKTPIHVIGGGATGSWLTFSLAKMGIENVTVYDFDEVGMHNLPNQLFGVREVDQNKAMALKNIIRRFTGLTIKARNVKFESQTPLQGIVFILTDTMKSRKDIFNRSIKNNPMIELVIETRMDLRGGRVYAFDPKNKEMCKKYESTLYSDDDAEVSACGVSQTVLPTAMGIVSYALWKMLNHIDNAPFENETILDFSNEIVFNSFWKEEEKVKKVWRLDDVVGKVFHIKSEVGLEKFKKICKELDITWRSGEKFAEKTHYQHHKGDTCYFIDEDDNTLTYGDIKYYERSCSNKELIVFE